ncbi:hypothetical protein KSP39_PZI012849 [Platanthera zijinensis]|uniref:Reverse transcriptase Ty1/copia-type domain-containing protein n=1 Tax=Platanthera zijinensis TaxID=2320716 RepID=A0AAP0BBL2_9ASPA
MYSIRVVLGPAARLDLEIEKMDVKTAFLHGDLDEELYMEQLEGNTARIAELKRQLSSTFEMKDMGAAKTILGMHIRRDRGTKFLWLSQERYIRKVLHRFDMDQAKKVSVPLAAHFRLTTDHCPSTPDVTPQNLEEEPMALFFWPKWVLGRLTRPVTRACHRACRARVRRFFYRRSVSENTDFDTGVSGATRACHLRHGRVT